MDKFAWCARKVYGIVLMKRLMEVTKGRASEKQRLFWKEKGCVDQIFAIKKMAEEYLGKGEKLYADFMDLRKSYHRID